MRLEAQGSVEDDVDAVVRRLERSRDHLGGTAVAAHGVNGYPRHYGAGVVSGSTSRPRYVLQFGQTWWGRLG